MDTQYKLLKTVCRISGGKNWVSYSEVKRKWKKCPEIDVVLNMANFTYVDAGHDNHEDTFFPKPEAYSYVRQCRDSIRNLIVTTATLLISVGTLLATFYSLSQMTLK